nr:psi-producing oxygenase a [Quercus suber]
MSGQFVFLFFDIDPVKTFPLALLIHKVIGQLGQLVLANVKWVSKTGWLEGIMPSSYQAATPLKDYGVHMVQRLLETGLDPEEITYAHIMGTAGAMIMDYYMSPAGHSHWPEIQRIARSDTPEAEDQLLRYAMEGIRLNGTFGGYRRAAGETSLDDTNFSGENVDIKPGDKVFVSFVKASRDPSVFPEPDTVRLDRDMESYIHYGKGAHRCIGEHASKVGLTAMLQTVARLKNLRPAPGAQGVLKKVPREDGFYAYMTESWNSYFPFPTTWKMHFDGEIPERWEDM